MRIIVTGGAGFIGSHLLLSGVEGGHDVVAIDDFSGAATKRLPEGAVLVEADICDFSSVHRAFQGADLVFHLAAKRAVLRSVEHPLETDRVNTFGTLTVLQAAREAGVPRVILASSSSVYGGSAPLPSSEAHPPAPRSPYAVSKFAGEQYARVFHELFGVETVCLRYFNVFGPRQRPDSQYAAVIPLFISALRAGKSPTVHGDGRQARDFTYVADVVAANWAAAAAPSEVVAGRVFNVAGGRSHSVLEVLNALQTIMGTSVAPDFGDTRPGDVRDSHADITAARRDLGFEPRFGLEEGLEMTVRAFQEDGV